MSRLIVKGLPVRYDDAKLRKLFTPLGEVTDARVMKTTDGRSRCFGFVGFRTKQDASRARSAMHRAYVETRPVFVEIAHAKGNDAIPRPWSRYSVGSSSYKLANDAQEHEGKRSKSAKKILKSEKKTELLPIGEIDEAKSGSDIDKTDPSKKEMENERATSVPDDKDFAAFEEVAGPRTSTRIRTGTVSAKQEIEQVKSKRNGSKGQVVERKHMTFEDDSDKDDDSLFEELSIKNQTKEVGPQDDSEAGDKVALNESVSDADYFKSKQVEKSEDPINDTETDFNIGKDPSENVGYIGSKIDNNDDHRLMNAQKKPPNSLASEQPDKTVHIAPRSGEAEIKTVDAGETGRLLVRNLAFSVNEEELEEAFSPFGELAEVHIVRDKESGQSRGMGFVEYSVPENAAKALMSLDRSYHCGRIMHVLAAHPKPTWNGRFGLVAKPDLSTFKLEKAKTMKEAAKRGKDIVSQHAQHLSADAVAEIAAERHNISKSDLFGSSRGESGVAAVRLALAEATIQNETKAYFLEHGIDLDVAVKVANEVRASTADVRKDQLSRTALLVKNLPAKTTERQLRSLFSRFGSIARIILAPSGVIGLVQYSTASDARRAQEGIAYTKFRGSPLYIEWLPAEALQVPQSAEFEKGVEPVDGSVATTTSRVGEILKPTNDDEVDQDENGCSVYVKNLSFETRDPQLKSHFEGALRKRPELLKSLRSAKVALKRGPEGRESEKLSMGFGFIEFARAEDAMEAVKLAQNTMLDGHVLRLQISKQSDKNGTGVSKKRKRSSSKAKAGPKLLVRNVAFEATRQEVRQLFASFGQLRMVRMPRKVDGSHRGFAFVEFASKNEATAAYEALSSTHLYGRHLAIEFADENDVASLSVAELQEKAAQDLVKKRRNVFTAAVGTEIRPKVEEEKDDDVMMQDELYG